MDTLKTIYKLFISLPDPISLTDSSSVEPLHFSPRDLGEEINEEELASELIASLPGDMQDPMLPAVDPEEFETDYLWFFS